MLLHSFLNLSLISKTFTMKTLKNYFLSIIFIAIATFASAQTKTETIKVSGECGMCKTTIEKAAKAAGAAFAEWDVDSKVLTVKYKNASSNTAKIEKAVAGAGYDTQSIKATDEAYSKLHTCCKYDRAGSTASTTVQSCCDDAKCTTAGCMKDGKCEKDMSCCKQAECATKDCCKKS
jgi:periplasmic mercuric ion binding protein